MSSQSKHERLREIRKRERRDVAKKARRASTNREIVRYQVVKVVFRKSRADRLTRTWKALALIWLLTGGLLVVGLDGVEALGTTIAGAVIPLLGAAALTAAAFAIGMTARKFQALSAFQRGFSTGRSWISKPREPRVLVSFFALLLPPRIAREELGDALEQMTELQKAGCPAWQLWARAISAVAWAVFHTATWVAEKWIKASGS